VLLPLLAESRRVGRVARHHPYAAAALEAVAADVTSLLVLQVPESRHVDPARAAIVERPRRADAFLHQTGDARPHQVLAEVVADDAAGVRDAVRMGRRV